MPAVTKLLRIEAPHFIAGAIWTKYPDIWLCTEAAPIIRWMIGLGSKKALSEISRHRWKYEWILI